MYAAFPRSDYYGGSAPRPRRHRTRRLATLRDTWRSDRGSLVQRMNPWCGRWPAIPLAAPVTPRFGTGGETRPYRSRTVGPTKPTVLAQLPRPMGGLASIQGLPSPTSGCSDIYPRVLHHDTCGGPPPVRLLRAFQAVRLLQAAVPISATFTAPFCARPDPGKDDFFRSSVPPLLQGVLVGCHCRLILRWVYARERAMEFRTSARPGR